jgi:hypothetical protein
MKRCSGSRTRDRMGAKLMPYGPKITAFLAAIGVMPNVTRAAKIHKSQHYAKLKSSSVEPVSSWSSISQGTRIFNQRKTS